MDTEEANRQDLFAEHERAEQAKHAAVEQRTARKREQAEQLQKKIETRKAGGDYERQLNLKYTAEEVELWRERKSTDGSVVHGVDGMIGQEERALRRQEKLFDRIQPDMNAYQRAKAERAVRRGQTAGGVVALVGDGSSSSSVAAITSAAEPDLLDYANGHDYKPSHEGIQRMVNDLKEQDRQRVKRVRVKVENASDDVTFINSRNRQFNETAQRYVRERVECVFIVILLHSRLFRLCAILNSAYGKYTEEIKESFERGTAL